KTKVRDPSSCLFGLRVVSQPGAGLIIELGSSGQTVMLGSDPSRAQVVLDNPTVSGLHAELKLNTDRTIWVTDLGSSNGTWVGESDLRVTGQAALRSGQQIQFGTLIATIEVI
ncbi:MAG TPA: FHA domain-containing protein, partial [Myxococcales bacterium]|nr:FHA domain-containing protein [Myxococcales bacterium]